MKCSPVLLQQLCVSIRTTIRKVLVFKIWSQLMEGKIKLAHFILAGALAIAFISFSLAHLLTVVYFGEILRENTVALSQRLSHHIKRSMVDQMKRGIMSREGRWQQELDDSGSAAGAVNIRVLGREDSTALDVRYDLRTKDSFSFLNQASLTNVYPLVAESECMGCHADVKKADILGFIRIEHDLSPILNQKRFDLFFLFLVLSPLPIIMALLMARFVSWKIVRSTSLLHDKIKAANLASDITALDLKHVNLGFLELNQILLQWRRFTRKFKSLTVDKKILEFEIELLEKFIITSDVVKDWKEYVGKLLLEVNRVMNAYTMFSIFKVDDEIYDLEIFWRSTPSESTRNAIQQVILEKIEEKCGEYYTCRNFNIIHNIVDPSSSLDDLEESDISLQTKSLIMDSPRIGGVIGIGVQSRKPRDAVRTLVIDGILTTLLNVVGSIKAIYKYTRELEYFATRDPLTQLYNQRMFWELLSYEVMRAHRRGYRFTVIVIDFDNFKFINDNFGHKFGDIYLKEGAIRIRCALREGDILTRYGGDEFAIILPETCETEAFGVAQRIRAEIEQMSLTSHNGTRVRATISQGLATYPDHSTSDKQMFVIADNMMYRAKSEGKNSICRPTAADVTEIFQQEEERSQLVMRALDNEGIVHPYFQPIMNLRNGEIAIHELLMRVEDRGKLITASEFVSKAEELGVMHKLDLIIIRKAFETIRSVQYAGLLFINVSPKSLMVDQFIGDIRKLANLYGIQPKNIVFEITERDTVRNLDLLEKFVADLKTEGFRFAVDDFGSGFSSFPYLKSFAIDFLKIDGEFILNMPHDPTFRAFTKSIVTLAKELRIETVAEYVENQEILELVADFGIDYAQGFHIAPPGGYPCPTGDSCYMLGRTWDVYPPVQPPL